MAEQRKKSDSILLRVQGKTISLELYPSSEWPERVGEGLFRVRLDGQWHCPTGKYSFLTPAAVGELVAALLRGGQPPDEEAAPHFPAKADVKVFVGEEILAETGSVAVAPYQKRDGRWYAQVWCFGRGVRELCCDDMVLIRIRR